MPAEDIRGDEEWVMLQACVSDPRRVSRRPSARRPALRAYNTNRRSPPPPPRALHLDPGTRRSSLRIGARDRRFQR